MPSTGLALLVLGAALAVVEGHVVSHGVLGTVAVTAIAVGIALIVTGAGAGVAAGVAAGLVAGAVGAAYGAFVLRHALAARRAPVRGGVAGLIGHRGEVRVVPEPVGHVLVDGALWRARMSVLDEDEDEDLHPGDQVVVEDVDGLTLTVRRAEEWEVRP